MGNVIISVTVPIEYVSKIEEMDMGRSKVVQEALELYFKNN